MFKLVKILNGRQNVGEPVRLTRTASTAFDVGDLLVLSSGRLIQATATSAGPYYIAAEKVDSTRKDYASATGMLVTPVTPDMIFEAPLSEYDTSLAEGGKVTVNVVSSHAVGVTSTAKDGVVTVHSLAGTGSGHLFLRVRFV